MDFFRESFELDDDDYELLLDNNVKVSRKVSTILKSNALFYYVAGIFMLWIYGWHLDFKYLILHFFSLQQETKLKRLKKADTDVGHSDEDEFNGTRRSGRTAEEQVKRSLFGDDDGELLSLSFEFCLHLTS